MAGVFTVIVVLLMLAHVCMMEDIIHTATSGHNIMILGQAGTGKSFLVNNLSKRLKEMGETVYFTASIGIVASQLHGMTIHKFSGILDSRFPDEFLIDKIKNDDDMIDIKRRNMNANTLFIDEISMLSLKLFLQIEKVFKTVKENNFPFGGIQFIVAGDFFQLKPVPNDVYHDRGELIISYEKIFSLREDFQPDSTSLCFVTSTQRTEGEVKVYHSTDEGDTAALLVKL